MKLTKSKLKEIIREEIQKLKEANREIGGYYLMKQLKDLAHDAKRNREKKLEKGLMYLHGRINQSYRDIDLNAEDVLDLFSDPRGKKYGDDVPSWVITDLFEALGTNKPSILRFKGIKKNNILELYDGTIIKVLERVAPRIPQFFGLVKKVGSKIKNVAGKKAKVGDTAKFAEAYIMKKIK